MKRIIDDLYIDSPAIELRNAHQLSQTIPTNKPKSTEPLLIVQPTRFDLWKGSHHNIKAVSELIEEGYSIRFLHCGADEMRLNIKRNEFEAIYPSLFQDYLSDKITFIKADSQEIAEIIESAGIILHPTVGIGVNGEPYSIACAQSIPAAKPIIMKRSGNLEVLANLYSRNQLIEPNNYKELKSAIKRWLDQPIPSIQQSDLEYIETLKQQVEQSISTFYALDSTQKIEKIEPYYQNDILESYARSVVSGIVG
jgi:glycosyltransferase involved in cell wall biosynthesis